MRGQAHTLEATVAALLLLTSLIFALQMTAVTPLSASTSSQHIENQQQAVGQGVLATAARTDSLKPAVLYWNNSTREFHGANEDLGYYTSAPPNNTFGGMLERSFNDEGIAYNVYLRFQNLDGESITRRYVYNGVPSDNAVTATRTITLVDSDPLYDEDGVPTATRLRTENVTYPIPDTGDNLHNTVRVEVVAWRI
ncbi:hypothetical protein KTS45_10415 [Halomicroarcula limicola]|uniref:Uncharacterized protein n=1 Tax=Haloarcula limicola TaxID=1429915 RepID=A0A8J8C8I6_9EURY|nr:hypothetical protein [Halomicroarcula limicola]MBV0924610.1 hypothetical protein [Halomicroarcula limicola]